LIIAGLVRLKLREYRRDNAGLDLDETADALADVGQQALNPFSAITDAKHPTREFQPIERQKAAGARRRSRSGARVVAGGNGKPTAKIRLEMKKDLGASPLSPCFIGGPSRIRTLDQRIKSSTDRDFPGHGRTVSLCFVYISLLVSPLLR
jgi:hypothetical protein